MQDVDCVFHEAALASVPRSIQHPLDTHAACVTGTVMLLDAARRSWRPPRRLRRQQQRLWRPPAASKRETDLPNPLSPYAAAKLAGELYMRAFRQFVWHRDSRLRYFNVFGPRQDPNSPYSAVIPLFITAICSGKQPQIYGDGTQSRDFTFIANVVARQLAGGRRAGVSGKVFNLAGGRSTTLLELLKLHQSAVGDRDRAESFSRREPATCAKAWRISTRPAAG